MHPRRAAGVLGRRCDGQALPAENPDLDLCHVQPTRMLGRVVKLYATQQLAGSMLSKHVVEKLSEVGVQVVQDNMNPARFCVHVVQQVTDERD